MQEVFKRLPKARLHLVNCTDPKMKECFQTLTKQCKWWPFLRTIAGPVADINLAYNKADIAVSCLFPLYARVIEALGAGKAIVAPGYHETGYPWACELHPASMADAIVKCWENYQELNYRKWATERHDVAETVRQSLAIYERYL
jgi:hypothetical protein